MSNDTQVAALPPLPEPDQKANDGVCCGNFTTGAEYMGQRETMCCGQPDERWPDYYTAEQMQSYARDAVEAALRDAPQQTDPTDAKDAARYRYLVVMETKAAPDTVAHYIRNPAHLDRVIEVMEQKP